MELKAIRAISILNSYKPRHANYLFFNLIQKKYLHYTKYVRCLLILSEVNNGNRILCFVTYINLFCSLLSSPLHFLQWELYIFLAHHYCVFLNANSIFLYSCLSFTFPLFKSLLNWPALFLLLFFSISFYLIQLPRIAVYALLLGDGSGRFRSYYGLKRNIDVAY